MGGMEFFGALGFGFQCKLEKGGFLDLFGLDITIPRREIPWLVWGYGFYKLHVKARIAL